MGSTATYDHEVNAARGVYPSALAFSSLMMRDADAPSVRKEELAAVCVPCGLMNAGLSLETDSLVESPLIPFSVVDPL